MKLNKIYSVIITPIKNFPVLFLMGGVLLFLPELMKQDGLRAMVSYFSTHLATTLCFSFAISYVLCLGSQIFNLIDKKVGNVVEIVALALLVLYSFTSVYLYKAFGILHSATSLELVLQTNASEASEFVGTYITDQIFLRTLALYITIIAAIAVMTIFKNAARHFLSICLHYGLLVLLIIWALPLSMHRISTFFYMEPGHFAGGQPFFDVRNHQIYKDGLALLSLKKDKIDINFERMVFDTRVDTSSTLSPNVIPIIGESYNRHHSSLYGYSQNTCPEMTVRNPYVFTDVVAPINSTLKVIRCLLSMEESGNEDFRGGQLLCPIMKNAGYNVTFYSNQNIKTDDFDGWDMALNMLFDNPVIEKNSFDHRNTAKFPTDGEFIDHFLADIPNMEILDGNNFTIVHLMDNHVAYADRFPSSEAKLKANEVCRSELSDAEKQLVADYDNAIIYNDKQVARIFDYYAEKEAIIVYLSDHGDEANDFRIHTGRIHSFEGLPPAAYHCQLDVPFLIFVTDLYREHHPEIIEEIEQSLSKPFMTDYLPYLILHLGNVKSGWYSPEKCILDSLYDSNRSRILLNGTDYDKVCSYNDKIIGF